MQKRICFYTDLTLKFFAKKANTKQFNNNTKNYFLTILFILVFILLLVLTEYVFKI